MKRGRNGSLIALALVLCVAMPVGGICLTGQSDDPENESSSTFEDFEIVEKDWAIYLYLGGDNDEEEVIDFSINQCVRALRDAKMDGSELHMLALLDRNSVSGTWVYELTENGREAAYNWPEQERNTSDPATMVEFLDYAMLNYPAANTMLVVKSGHAWCGVCPDYSEPDGSAMMTIDGLASATADRDIDVIALDGDNMASIEVAYELRHSTRYLVGTQQDMPIDGLPYYLTFKHLAETPSMLPVDLAIRMVTDFVIYYNNTDGKKNMLDHLLADSDMAVTASAFDMGDDGEKMDSVVGAFSDLVNYMVNGELPDALGGGLAYDSAVEDWAWISYNRSNIAAARDAALIGKMGDQAGYEWLPDIYTWLEALNMFVNSDRYNETFFPNVTDTALLELVAAFHEEFNKSLVYLDQSQILNRSGLSTPHGLNMWFPPSWTQWDILDYSREREYYYNGSKIELPAEVFCVDCPYHYSDVQLDLVEDTLWMTWFGIYYDSKWTIYGDLDAPRETPLW